jgi:chemotaxis protein histidine kinase CheA
MVAVDLSPEITASFVAEARSYLPEITRSLDNLQDAGQLAEAYRFAHTIKSSAAMMGHVGLSQLAELLESDLEAFLYGDPWTPSHVAQLGRSVTRIAHLLDAVAGRYVDLDAVIADEVDDRLSVQAEAALHEIAAEQEAITGSGEPGLERGEPPPHLLPGAETEMRPLLGEPVTTQTLDPPLDAEDIEPVLTVDGSAPSLDPQMPAGLAPAEIPILSPQPELGAEPETVPVDHPSPATMRPAWDPEKVDAAGDNLPQEIPSPGVTPLLNELAETILTLNRESASGSVDLQAYRNAFTTWLAQFDTAAGLVEPSDELQPPPVPSSAPLIEPVELDPTSSAEDALRATLEAEIRFQFEEELSAKTAATAPALDTSQVRRGAAKLRGPIREPSRPATDIHPAGVTPVDSPEDLEMREVFRLEAGEHLKRIDADVAALKGTPGDVERLRSLRRTVHTLKGAAAMMGFEAVAALAHSLEDRLETAVDGAPLDSDAYTLLLSNLNHLDQLVNGATFSPNGAASPVSHTTGSSLDATDTEASTLHAAALSVPVPLDRLDTLLTLAGQSSVSVAAWPNLLHTAEGALRDLRRSTARVQSLLTSVQQERDPLDALASHGTSQSSARQVVSQEPSRLTPLPSIHSAIQADFDPLELDRYTSTDHVALELAEIAAEAYAAERELASIVDSAGELAIEQRRHTKEIQDRLLAVRLVPLNDLAGRLQRAAKSVAARRGKEVEFDFDGGEAAIDRAILDPVADALIHLVRNAADHGVEHPADRLTRGKAATGRISVVARQDIGDVVIEIADDGAGIDIARVLASAREAGLPTGDLDPETALDLIFRPGLSTASVVDDVSGRGVGLDAVAGALARVRGSIEVETAAGQGTTFTLRVPATLAQARVLMAEVAGNPIAVPAAGVRWIARLGEVKLERFGSESIARLEGLPYPVSDLTALLDLPADPTNIPADPPLLFVESGGQRGAWVASSVGQHEEVVIKPLGAHLHGTRGLAGATLLQDGRVALLLHLPDLLGHPAAVPAYSRLKATMGPSQIRPSVAQDNSAPLRILVVDDSPTIRKLLVRTLKDLGWQPAEAKDGAEALEAIRHKRPDIVLADIEMPRLDGYGLLAAIRSQPETSELPVLMLTSRTAERHRRRAAELGASGYLTKPYRPADVVAELRRLGSL